MQKYLDSVADGSDGSPEVAPAVPVALKAKSDGHLSYREAIQSPCLSCSSSPCCTYLLLLDFTLESLLDVDYARYLLNFEGIVLGLGPNGKVDVYFYQPCGYLDIPTGLCTVHGTPMQPSICTHYNDHSCGYRHRMTVEVDPVRPLVDRHRMAWYADQLSFDETRRIVALPAWDDVQKAFLSMPLERRPAPSPRPDPVIEEWRSLTLSRTRSNGKRPGAYGYSDAVVSDPCQGCEAWCCKTLLFSRDRPGEVGQLDFFRYCLGFPGVEVGVADDGWALIVRTTCRHLEDNRCSVYGLEERPLKCSYYDELKCKYRAHLGTPRPDEIVRISRDQFTVLAEAVVFDDTGRVVELPSVKALRELLEDAERVRADVLA
jgi:hypothetical protein